MSLWSTLIRVVGNVAHDTADTGAPLKVGTKSIAVGSSPTEVAASDRSDRYSDRMGVPWTQLGDPGIIWSRFTYTGANTNATILTPTSTNKLVIYWVQATVAATNLATPLVRIGLAASTTPTATGVIISHPAMIQGSIVTSAPGVVVYGAASDKLLITSDDPSGTLDVVVAYKQLTT